MHQVSLLQQRPGQIRSAVVVIVVLILCFNPELEGLLGEHQKLNGHTGPYPDVSEAMVEEVQVDARLAHDMDYHHNDDHNGETQEVSVKKLGRYGRNKKQSRSHYQS